MPNVQFETGQLLLKRFKAVQEAKEEFWDRWVKEIFPIFFFIINLMSVHDPAKFQQCCVKSAKSAADAKNRMFFRDCALFMVNTVYHYWYVKME
jgi:hypothetical protein